MLHKVGQSLVSWCFNRWFLISCNDNNFCHLLRVCPYGISKISYLVIIHQCIFLLQHSKYYKLLRHICGSVSSFLRAESSLKMDRFLQVLTTLKFFFKILNKSLLELGPFFRAASNGQWLVILHSHLPTFFALLSEYLLNNIF